MKMFSKTCFWFLKWFSFFLPLLFFLMYFFFNLKKSCFTSSLISKTDSNMWILGNQTNFLSWDMISILSLSLPVLSTVKPSKIKQSQSRKTKKWFPHQSRQQNKKNPFCTTQQEDTDRKEKPCKVVDSKSAYWR